MYLTNEPLRGLVFFVLALLVSGCGDGYTWSRAGPPASGVMWIDVPDLLDYCEPQPDLLGCAHYRYQGGLCVVYSIYSEARAKTVKVNGVSHYDHEMRHCNGEIHAEKHVRGIS